MAKGNTRTTGTEQYYTPVVLAEQLSYLLSRCIPDYRERVWLEPAAGTGAFLKALDQLRVENMVALDKYPKSDRVLLGDFLEVELALHHAICITNPPFGRNHSLSLPFFNKAAQYCDVIAFVVPRSWRKWSVVDRLDAYFHKVLDVDLAVQYVNDEGDTLSKSSILNTVFQVWERQPQPRKPRQAPSPRLTLVKPEQAKVAFTLFGRGAGSVSWDFPRVKNTTKAFYTAEDEVLHALEQIDLRGFYNNVAYTEALSKTEVEYALDRYFDSGQTSFTLEEIARTTLAEEVALLDVKGLHEFASAYSGAGKVAIATEK